MHVTDVFPSIENRLGEYLFDEVDYDTFM